MKNLNDLAKSAAVIFVGTVIGRALGLLGETLIARLMAPNAYGHVALAYTVVVLVSRVALFGVNNGVTRMMSVESTDGDRRTVLLHGYLLVLVMSGIAVVSLLAGRRLIAQLLGDDQLVYYVPMLVPFAFFYPLAHVSFGALQNEGRSWAAVFSRDVARRLVPLAILAAALFVGEPVLGAIGYWVGTPLVFGLSTILLLQTLSSPQQVARQQLDRSVLRRLWKFSWPLALSMSIFVFLARLDILMIGYFLDSTSVGYYRAVQPLRQAATLVLSAFTFLYLPLATRYYERGEINALNELYAVSTKWIVVGTFPIVLVFGLFAEDVVRTFFGVEYVPGASALAILVIGLFFRAIVGLNGDMVKATGKTQVELYAAAVGLTINLVLNVLLIPRFGIEGAAVATASGYIVYNTVEVAAVYRSTGVHPFSPDNLKPLFPPALTALALFWLTRGLDLGIVYLLAIGVLLSVVQLIAVPLTRSTGPADIELIDSVEDEVGVNLSGLKAVLRRD